MIAPVAVLIAFGAWAPAAAAPIWLDLTGGDAGFAGFDQPTALYRGFAGDPAGVANFNDGGPAASPANQHAEPFGPPLLDEANAPWFDSAGLNVQSISEPSTNALVLFSAGLFLLRWPHRRKHTHA
jgi:hypothetical protein